MTKQVAGLSVKFEVLSVKKMNSVDLIIKWIRSAT
ncbi:hypothetical protein DESC_10002 [Desulfosarcina cetonica]|nr:hypothetical protein DESC_10002 [Desulfosarcina cetonica]